MCYRIANIFQMLVIIAIHSGRTSAAGILKLVLMNSRSSHSVSDFAFQYRPCLVNSCMELLQSCIHTWCIGHFIASLYILKYTPMKIIDEQQLFHDSWKLEGWYVKAIQVSITMLVWSPVLVCLKLQLFVQLHDELELFYTQLLDDVVKTCLSAIKYPGAASSSVQVQIDVYQATCWRSWVQKIHFSVWNFFIS